MRSVIHLTDEIELLRKEMYKLYQSLDNLQDPKLVDLSQRLDDKMNQLSEDHMSMRR
ncbi:aspartyl-phosphate phosphatase Spo0E family protein [Bacillaceae bacterium SIJ1]|uniref:aspartyl-phosphate phosphatase Spo0E family protein n=1 Tax=Litoribacterium kuwaitense TaxID=1398745 RepID=UPI0013EB15BF|nr:aspartyl-phosphate phosphatase Spo0E family protein [Litoribacterium kuwaitense]NGP44698.1 aspartyl-phosphate phosphatase Spo0E family protein [Litoribacterium kuwaitense]